jgi:prevent-host-death family protein
MKNEISIGQVKRDISTLVNRVAYGGERLVLTSRGKPKAALVSLSDLERLQQKGGAKGAAWKAWEAGTEALALEILERRGGQTIDVDALLREDRAELESRLE